MDTSLPYIRKQSDLLAEFKPKVRLTVADPRWSDPEFYLGMKEGVQQWDEMVRVPYWYTIPGGYTYGQYEYALPNYIRTPITPQRKRYIPLTDFGTTSTSYTWQDIPGGIEPDSTGLGQVLRLYAPPRSADGRVGFYAPNSVLPYASPLPTTTGGTLSSSGTSVSIGSTPDIGDVGIVDIGGEKIAYLGVTRGASSITLSNLVRGLFSTVAASHNSGSAVEWCVAVDDMALYNQLFDYTCMVLHRLFQADGSTHERAVHQQMMLFHQQQAQNFWAGYDVKRPTPKMKLGPRAFILR